MGKVKTIARRTFLIGSAAVAGGLVVGWALVKWPLRNPLLDVLDDDDATLNPYVKIDPNGITIITPRADVGQGAYSVQAMLVAEELDLEWGSFAVEPGPPSKAYFNEAVLPEGMPFASINDGFVARQGRALGGAISKLIGLQITGGSSTVPDAYEKLRAAGAVARLMLLEAASRRTGVPVDQLKTENGHVVTPTGERIPYTLLAAEAAQIDPPSSVQLRDPAQWKFLGKPMQRLDIVAKSTGTAQYGIDLRMPGMVYATVRTNPRLGGSMISVDDSAAKSARGVIKVVPITNGVGIIADNTWRAFRAAALLQPQWGDAPYPKTSAEMFRIVGESFTDDRRDSRFRNDGDIEEALAAGGASVHSAEYKLPYLAHAPLEPMTAVVKFTGGKLEIWTATQIPRFLVQWAAKTADIDEDNVTLHALIAGGSFGRRLEDDYVRQAVQLAMAHPDVPIKLTWTREEDFTHDFPRPLAMGRGRGVVQDGRVDAFDLGIAAPATTASQMSRIGLSTPGPDISIVAGAWDQPYAIPHYRVTGYRVPELVPVSSWRSVGASINGFLHESFLDELIHAAGADPLRERIRLCMHEPSRRVLEAVAEMSGWGSPMGTGRGRGVALTVSFGVPVAEVVEVTDTPDGIRIDRVFVAAEVGRVLDPVNFENQVQGAVIWGLGHAMHAEITYADGVAEQTNFHLFETMRLKQVPEIVVRALEAGPAVRGIGEPPVPPAAPALANAIFAATGARVRELPMRKSVRFA
ncbi:molybdopterin-dependent oxidoreductase [Pseudogemmatithrix spongiicola]|uniref:Molybdopterin-dependent oxidoreductase n=1 Tax=Pseudogemmatithrix spongiicola TaxID=3062599 RepID=A0AA49K2N9_9BACT|nr:molybdopterin-dependent oxidoreductase [Gemmatimonadaceae bacterium 'strain 138']WKW16292.1 molybdopterin-dependent oxidoreductase [Gemmatimonadaceae bacterium 'strain 318']